MNTSMRPFWRMTYHGPSNASGRIVEPVSNDNTQPGRGAARAARRWTKIFSWCGTYYALLGRKCKNGHISWRYVGNRSCVQCMHDHTRAWEQRNRARANEKAQMRRAAKLQAMPVWADRTAILAVYLEAERLTLETGIEHHVDHVVPLQGLQVCGLHVPNNLRAIPWLENQRKFNKLEDENV